jgi:hypothetical protein
MQATQAIANGALHMSTITTKDISLNRRTLLKAE